MFIRRTPRFFSIWKDVPQGPPDPILGISEAFKRDTDPKKVNLGVGAYRDDNGKPVVLTSVQRAKSLIIKTADHDYLPTEGFKDFSTNASTLAFGDSKLIAEGKVASIQSLSGTGGLRLGIEFIQRFFPHSRTVYIPNPTWGNHKAIVTHTGLSFKEYTYYKPETKGLNFEGMLSDIDKAPKNSVFLLHACAHNPTGVDPTKEQWQEILKVMKAKENLVIFDMAYQGFASGDVDNDAYALRLFADNEVPVLAMQSFAKNFGLYGERIGNLSVVCSSAAEASNAMSQLKNIVKPMYSNPGLFGSRVVNSVLTIGHIKKQWLIDVKEMADRIIDMRTKLVKLLQEKGSKHDWSHITKQIGMFAYTGLSSALSEQMMKEHHIYLTLDGRISLAGLNSKNVNYVAEAIHAVTKSSNKI